MSMQVKICGMRDPENVREIAALQPDMMGFIFYEPSSRYVGEASLEEVLGFVPSHISKVAVFVNEKKEEVVRVCKKYGFDYAQLHGDESAAFCRAINEGGIGVIKAIPVADRIDFNSLKDYEPYVDLFLFDTKTKGYGGSGKQFDRTLLDHYPLSTPYFLSGGIGETDIETILDTSLPGCVGIDANSRLEIEPGLKNIQTAAGLINQIRKR
jgi:phosphoribosylanthranilate isomerase